MTNGILLVNKPQGWTSFDVVNYVRKIVASDEQKKPKHIKVGHTGTLDPLATGLLVLLLGTYTKRAAELSRLDKTYEVTMRLGETSDTGDGEGEITSVSLSRPSRRELDSSLKKFTGNIMQKPPVYSAIKVNGQRAYKLARAGKAVELEPRPVTVFTIKDVDYHYPSVSFSATVSSGTYIRSLVGDIGNELGVGAYMSALRRTAIGDFDLGDAIEIKQLDAAAINSGMRVLE